MCWYLSDKSHILSQSHFYIQNITFLVTFMKVCIYYTCNNITCRSIKVIKYIKALPPVLRTCEIKHEAHGRDTNKAWGKATSRPCWILYFTWSTSKAMLWLFQKRISMSTKHFDINALTWDLGVLNSSNLLLNLK